MKKPTKTLLKLVDLGWIHGIHAKQVQTGTDTADTRVVITGSNGAVKGWWRTYSEYLDVDVGRNHVAEVKRRYTDEVRRWKEFEKENEQELAEYERLKAKFENS